MNPMDVFKNMLKTTTPKNVVMKLIKNNTNPMIINMINMANNGDTKRLENVARNILKEQGIDFDKEFSNFMSNFKQ